MTQGRTQADYKTYQLVGLLLGPVCFAVMMLSPVPAGLSAAGWMTAALGVWMAIWWATEAVPLFATSLLPLVLLPLLGVSNLNAAAAPFANPVVFLLFGGFLIALAVERWNLHRRVAFHIILKVGNRPLHLIGGVMLATAAISMWISNTATTVMMLPIATSLVAVVLPPDKENGHDGANFTAAMLLGVAYAELPARLRMTRLARPATNRADLELFSLAVSAVNGCETCVRAHEHAVRTQGVSEAQVHDAVRIAPAVHAFAIALDA